MSISRILICLFFGCFFVFGAIESHAQKGWEVGGWLGMSHYFGDLNTHFDLSKPGLALGLNARYNFNERIATKFSFSYGSIRADDADSPNSFERMRNLSFKSQILDFTPQLEFNFFPYVHGSKEYFFTPYIFAGFSVFYFNPRTELNGEWYSLKEFGTEGQNVGDEYMGVSGAFALGGGFKWDISSELSINIELGIRKVFTDYIDDVSQIYPDMFQLAQTRGQIAVDLSDRSGVNGIGDAGRQRGNSKDNDTYSFIGISIMKYFGRLECPAILNY